MSTTLSSRSKASIVVGIAVLAVVAGLAITTGGGDDSVVFSNAAQAQAQDGQGGDPQGRPCPGRGGPLGHAIHGELIVPEPPEDESEQAGEEPDEDAEPTFRNVVLDAGEVTAISDDSISLERPDGEEVTVGLTDDTKMREAPEEGDRAVVVADEDGNALRVMYRP
ncbi:MAG: hypothetical protein HYU28_09510, partial [Actinobacteria bacterium]|nr:hypothetical protein [Actinomycetota bacterium]